MNLKLRLAAVGDAGALAPVARIARVLDISAHPPTAVVVTIERSGAIDDSLVSVRGKLASGEIDIALCPAPRLPLLLPDGIEIAAVLRCRDARYRFVSLDHQDLSLLPHGSAVAVCDPVVRAQIFHRHPSLRVELVPADQAIGAGLRHHIWDAACVPAEVVESDPGLAELAGVVPQDELLPCVGQGLVALLVPNCGSRVRDSLRLLDDSAVRHCLHVERTFLTRIGAFGLGVAATARAVQSEGHIELTGLLSDDHGRWLVMDQARAPARFGEIVALEIADACRKLAQGRIRANHVAATRAHGSIS